MTNDSTTPQVYVADRESNQYVTALHENVLYLLENVSKRVQSAPLRPTIERPAL